MPDTNTNAAPTSTWATLFSAGLTAATALAQDAEIFAGSFGANRAASKIATGLNATVQVAPSLVGTAQLLAAIGTLFAASAHAHAATTAVPEAPEADGSAGG